MLVPNGVYKAIARGASVYQNAKQNLIACFTFKLTEPAEEILIKSYSTLAMADGTMNIRSIDNVKEIFGWDGHDPFWLVDTDLSAIPVELVIENVTKENGRTYSQVKWMNKSRGDHGAQTPTVGDRESIVAKFAAQFRALVGESSLDTKNAPGGQSCNTASMPKAPSATEPNNPVTTPVSNMGECWAALCQANPGAERGTLEKVWFEAVAKLFPGKVQSDLSPTDWGRLKLNFTDNLRY